ncbi:helix-turn-helix transcriptional regulator [Maribacter sp. X9]|uniref:helix-turn-helix transcriptional regulator n=1 Tax=Maribacter sp. X9 TaxID=3402159 RepID=UPI003AF3DE35
MKKEVYMLSGKGIKFLAKEIAKHLNEVSNPQIHNTEDIFLNIEETADLIHLSRYTIYSLVNKNTIPYHKRGRRLYFLKSEILTWLKNGKREDKAALQNKVDEYLLKNQL